VPGHADALDEQPEDDHELADGERQN